MKQINRYQVRRYIPLYHEDLDIVGMDGAYEALLAAVDQSPMGRVRRVLSQAGDYDIKGFSGGWSPSRTS